MSRVFIPSFGRRRKPPAREATAPVTQPPVWTGRKREKCELLKFKGADGKTLCEGEGTFIRSTGNEITCSPKCKKKLKRITGNRTSAKYVKTHLAKVRASNAASIKKRRTNDPEFRKKEAQYRKDNPDIYVKATRKYLEKQQQKREPEPCIITTITDAKLPTKGLRPAFAKARETCLGTFLPHEGNQQTCSDPCSDALEKLGQYKRERKWRANPKNRTKANARRKLWRAKRKAAGLPYQ